MSHLANACKLTLNSQITGSILGLALFPGLPCLSFWLLAVCKNGRFRFRLGIIQEIVECSKWNMFCHALWRRLLQGSSSSKWNIMDMHGTCVVSYWVSSHTFWSALKDEAFISGNNFTEKYYTKQSRIHKHLHIAHGSAEAMMSKSVHVAIANAKSMSYHALVSILLKNMNLYLNWQSHQTINSTLSTLSNLLQLKRFKKGWEHIALYPG